MALKRCFWRSGQRNAQSAAEMQFGFNKCGIVELSFGAVVNYYKVVSNRGLWLRTRGISKMLPNCNLGLMKVEI